MHQPSARSPRDRFKWCNWLALTTYELDWFEAAIEGTTTGSEPLVKEMLDPEDNGRVVRSLTVSQYVKGSHRYLAVVQKRIDKKDSKILIPWAEKQFVVDQLAAVRRIVAPALIAAAEA